MSPAKQSPLVPKAEAVAADPELAQLADDMAALAAAPPEEPAAVDDGALTDEQLAALKAEVEAANAHEAALASFDHLGGRAWYVLSQADVDSVSARQAVGGALAPGDVCPATVTGWDGEKVHLTVFTPCGTHLVRSVETCGPVFEVGAEHFGLAFLP